MSTATSEEGGEKRRNPRKKYGALGPPMDDKGRTKEVFRHTVQLREHFDTVAIVCTREEGGVTRTFHYVQGNAFAVAGSLADAAAQYSADGPISLGSDDDEDDDD